MSVVLLDTDDLAETEQVLSEHYTKQRLSADRDAHTHARIERSALHGLISDQVHFSYDLEVEAEPLDNIVLCRVHSGAIVQTVGGGTAETCGPGQVKAGGAYEGVGIHTQLFRPRYDTIVIDRQLLGRVAAVAVGSEETQRVRLTSTVALSARSNAVLCRAVDYVRHTMLRNSEVLTQPLAASEISHLLAATMLGAYPNTALLQPTAMDRNDGSPVLLRKAIAFIDDNAHRDISVTDIAAAVYVTPRALQYMFRKHRNCTPMEYLRTVRMHYAHLELVAGDRRTDSVTQIATKWGFYHLGRFAVAYRQTYGRSPHQTLRGDTAA